MIDRASARLAFRNRALALSVCATSGIDLAATALGYTRQSGSFITEGYTVGMEVVPTGFTQTDPGLVIGVAAQLLTIDGGRTVQTSGSGRTLSVGLPTAQAWERVRFEPTPGRWFVEESFVPATKVMRTMPAQGGVVEETGLYVLRLYGVDELGTDGLDAVADALLALFTPGTSLVVGSDTVRVREDIAATAGQAVAQDGGWAVIPITVPWRAFTRNTIAA